MIKKRRTLDPDTLLDDEIPEGTPLEVVESNRRAKDPSDYRRAILTEHQLMAIKIPPEEYLLRGLITTKTITMVNGYRGHGKSWFVEAIANEVAWGGQLGPWKVDKSVNTLLIDGEMSLREIQDRMRRMNIDRNVFKRPSKLYIYPEAEAHHLGLNRANLLDEKWRDAVRRFIEMFDVQMLILDNLASLAPGIDENAKIEFDDINRWMLELRFDGYPSYSLITWERVASREGRAPTRIISTRHWKSCIQRFMCLRMGVRSYARLQRIEDSLWTWKRIMSSCSLLSWRMGVWSLPL